MYNKYNILKINNIANITIAKIIYLRFDNVTIY